MGRVVPWGPKKGRGHLEGSWVTIVSLGTAASPHYPRVPLPIPKEVALVYSEDLVTVSLFLKYEL